MGLRPISANLTWRLPKSEKTLVFWISKSPQSRHPERSASQMDRVTQRLAARSRGNPDAAYLPMLFGAFQPPAPVSGSARLI